MLRFVVCSFLVTCVGVYGGPVVEKRSLYPEGSLEGRPLIIRSYPAVEDFRSNLYEVYAQPYAYDIAPTTAIAVLGGEGESDVKGELVFTQRHPPTGPVWIKGNITGLSSGKHGLHIYQSGDLREGCDKLGGHFNPFLTQHGGPRDNLRHAGDLGNVEAPENGIASINIIDHFISLSGGPKGIVGRAVAITSNEDDLGRAENAESIVGGNSGKPLACGVISYIR